MIDSLEKNCNSAFSEVLFGIYQVDFEEEEKTIAFVFLFFVFFVLLRVICRPEKGHEEHKENTKDTKKVIRL